MTLPDYYDFKCSFKTSSGKKAMEHLPYDLGALNAYRPLVITNKRARRDGLIKQLTGAFKGSGLSLGIYDGVTLASDVHTIKKLVGIHNDGGFDSIIAAGTGVVVDVAKILNVVVSGSPRDLKNCAGVNNISTPLKPLVFVPTSLGSGKESTTEASLGDLFFSSQFLSPNMVVIDPRMLMVEETGSIATAAMTALAYSAEAYAREPGNPLVNTYAHACMRLIMDHLLGVVKGAMEEKGRLAALMETFKPDQGLVALANAVVMGGCVYSNALPGAARKLGIEASRHCEASPGVCTGILLTYVLEHMAHREGRPLEKILLPLAGVDGYCGTPEGQRFESAIGKIRQLQNDLYMIASPPVPRTLEDAKTPRDKLEEIAKAVSEDESIGYDKKECLLILEHAFEGKVL